MKSKFQKPDASYPHGSLREQKYRTIAFKPIPDTYYEISNEGHIRSNKGRRKILRNCYKNGVPYIWCEVYLGDHFPYCWIIGDGFIAARGLFFDSPKDLKTFLGKIFNSIDKK